MNIFRCLLRPVVNQKLRPNYCKVTTMMEQREELKGIYVCTSVVNLSNQFLFGHKLNPDGDMIAIYSFIVCPGDLELKYLEPELLFIADTYLIALSMSN